MSGRRSVKLGICIAVLVGVGIPSALALTATGDGSRVARCPSLTETNAHYEASGQDFKPTVPCPPAETDESGGQAETHEEMTPAERQELQAAADRNTITEYDPSTGLVHEIHVQTVGDVPLPEWVDTRQDLNRLLEARGGKPLPSGGS